MATITLDRLITHVLSVSDFDETNHKSSNGVSIPEVCSVLGDVSTYEIQTVYEKDNISLYYCILSVCNEQFSSMTAFNRMNLIHVMVNNFYKTTNNIDFLDYKYTKEVFEHLVEYFRINLIIFKDEKASKIESVNTNRLLMVYEEEGIFYPLGINNIYELEYSEYKDLVETEYEIIEDTEITNQFIDTVVEEEEKKELEQIYYTTKMRIAELQEIAESHGISILNGNKKKTKKDLIEDFKLYNSSI